jgi:hypothetical protein
MKDDISIWHHPATRFLQLADMQFTAWPKLFAGTESISAIHQFAQALTLLVLRLPPLPQRPSTSFLNVRHLPALQGIGEASGDKCARRDIGN